MAKESNALLWKSIVCWGQIVDDDIKLIEVCEEKQEQIRILAEAVLNCHNSFSRDVPPVRYDECDCEACKIARGVTSGS